MASSIDMFCFLLFCQLVLLIFSAGYGNGHQHNCPSSFHCGKVGIFHYPFTKAKQPDCGLIPILGCDGHYNSSKRIQLGKNGNTIELIGMVDQNTISLFDVDFYRRLQDNTCDALNKNYSLLSPSPLVSVYIKYNVTLFQCKHGLDINIPPAKYFRYNCSDYDIYYSNNPSPNAIMEAHGIFSSCSFLQFPVKDSTDTKNILSFISGQMVVGVILSVDCDDCYNHKGGQCQLDDNKKFYCDKAANTGKFPTELVVTIVGSLAGVAVLIVLACYVTAKILPPTFLFFRKENPTHRIIEEFLKEHGPLPATR